MKAPDCSKVERERASKDAMNGHRVMKLVEYPMDRGRETGYDGYVMYTI